MDARIRDVFQRTKIVPVAVFGDADSALRAVGLLEEESVPLVEVTLRTEAAFSCITEIIKRYPGVTVGAGSVLSVESLKRAADAGAAFFVAPCLDFEVIEYASALALSFIPGVATPSELNQALRIGCDVIKIFPAGVLGGVKYIDAVTAPFKTRRFGLIPTGGIDDTNVVEYFNNPFVIACGASSIVDQSLIGAGDYAALARKIRSMKKAVGA